MPITDIEYQLPVIEALSPFEWLENSANKPLIISGVNKATHIKGEYVVKFNGSERMYEDARAKELIAAFMAMQWGLHVVEPAIVNISKEFVEILRGKPYFQIAEKSMGYNVGSKYLQKLQTFSVNQDLTSEQLAWAQQIFAFDLIIQNNDRTYEKPNMITDGHSITLLDHELAFGFVHELPFLRNNTPWIFSEADMIWVKKHCLLTRIKNKEFDFETILDKLPMFDAQFWERAFNLIPNAWRSEMLIKIREHVTAIVDHRTEFTENLKYIML